MPELRILIVEDCNDYARLLGWMLGRSDQMATLTRATTVAEAEQQCGVSNYDVILLDLGLPDSQGPQGVERLHRLAPQTPIIVLTGDDRCETALEAIESGAQDYVLKQELSADGLLRIARQTIARHNEFLRVRNEARFDFLTGLGNRRSCDDALRKELAVHHRYRRPLTAAIIDIDVFKQINDFGGHGEGDHALRFVARALLTVLRTTDFVGRYGGDEFLVLLPGTAKQPAFEVLDRARIEVATRRLPPDDQPLSVSIGIAQAERGDSVAELVSRADAALYRAKEAGRGRCVADADLAAV